MEVKFKYKVGDSVKLIKEVPDIIIGGYKIYNRSYGTIHEFEEKEYKVKKCCWYIADDYVVHPCYWLDAYCDNNINYHNMVPEECLDGDVSEHIDIYELKDTCGNDLGIGDQVYESIIVNDSMFGFRISNNATTFWTIRRIKSFFMHENGIEAMCEYLYPTEYYDGSKRHTNMYEGYISSCRLSCLTKHLPDNFVGMYVSNCKKYRYNPFKWKGNYYSEGYEIQMWFEKLGLYEELQKVYNGWNKNKHKIKVKEVKKENSLIPDDMSDKDKEKLLKQLMEWKSNK